MIINVHAGHSLVCRGASALIDEVTEDRKVKNTVIALLRTAGHTVYDCTDDTGKDQSANLTSIVKKCNAHKVDLDVSIHFNACVNDLRGDGKTTGTEVHIYSANGGAKAYAENVCKAISQATGLKNRGVWVSPGLYVLRKTLAPAMLIECCFVDDADDVKVYNADVVAKAIVKGIIGLVPNQSTNNNTSSNISYYQRYTGKSTSIVDALQSLKIDSTFNSRSKIAVKNGISNYKGTAEQNTKMLRLLKEGQLIKA